MTRSTSEAVPRAAAKALCDEDEILEAVSRETSPPARVFEPGTFHRLPPIYFIGDSRTLPFRNAVYTSEFTARSYQLRSVHLRCLHAADFYSRDQGINRPLLDALATDQTVVSYDEGATWTATSADDGLGGTAPLVFFCGPYDAHRLMDELGPDADIPAWDETARHYDVSTVPASQLVSAEYAAQRALEIMEPFALGIEALRMMGFDRIFVHGCRRTRRGERFKRIYAHLKWLRQYHPNAHPKVQILFDKALQSIAARTGARYISGPIDARGELPAEVTFDDVHYNADGAREVVRSVISITEGVVE